MATLFLDIETTGLSRTDHITSVVWFFRGRWHRYVHGSDAPERLRAHWAASTELCTYNGRAFDEPFLRRSFRLPAHPCHTDLRWLLAKAGHRGGLKAISRRLLPRRRGPVLELDGWDAVRLWRRYQEGEEQALETLLAYNAWDVLRVKLLYAQLHPGRVQIVDPPFRCSTAWVRRFLDGMAVPTAAPAPQAGERRRQRSAHT